MTPNPFRWSGRAPFVLSRDQSCCQIWKLNPGISPFTTRWRDTRSTKLYSLTKVATLWLNFGSCATWSFNHLWAIIGLWVVTSEVSFGWEPQQVFSGFNTTPQRLKHFLKCVFCVIVDFACARCYESLLRDQNYKCYEQADLSLEVTWHTASKLRPFWGLPLPSANGIKWQRASNI